MWRLYQKNKLGFALMLIAVYVVFFSTADGLSVEAGSPKLITAGVGIALSAVLLAFLKKHQLMSYYGLTRFSDKLAPYLFFVPLAVLTTVNLWGGVNLTVNPLFAILHIVSMICVGFIEELIFRGFLFRALLDSNVRTAAIVASVTFGVGHIVNLANGAELLPTLLQLCYATAIGFLFTIIFWRSGSLIPCIAAHATINSLSVFCLIDNSAFEAILSAVMCIACVAYAFWIYKHTSPS